jgi:RNA polymerase sigma factor (sigma-70 family)
MSERRFLLVDEEGVLRDDRYQSVAQEIGRTFADREWYLDSAELDNLLGTIGDRLSAHEKKSGVFEDFSHFRAVFWKSFWNGLNSLGRKSEYRIRRGKVALETAELDSQLDTNSWNNNAFVDVHCQLLSEDCFRSLCAPERRIMWLKRDGYKSREIAQKLGLTETNVNVIVSRARACARFILSGQKLDNTGRNGNT